MITGMGSIRAKVSQIAQCFSPYEENAETERRVTSYAFLPYFSFILYSLSFSSFYSFVFIVLPSFILLLHLFLCLPLSFFRFPYQHVLSHKNGPVTKRKRKF